MRCQTASATSWILRVLVAATLLLATDVLAQSGDLQRLRDSVRDPSSSSSSGDYSDDDDADHGHHHHHYHSYSDDCEDDSDWDTFGAKFALYAVTSPFWVPHVAAGDDLEIRGFFPNYPFQDSDGFIVLEPDLAPHDRNWYARLSGDFGTDFGDHRSVAGQLLFDTTARFGLDAQWNYRHENLGLAISDELWTGDMNIVFRFAQSKRVQMRTGLGLNWLTDKTGSDYGFNFTYGGDIFLSKPWVFSGTIDWGTLGNATLFHGRATVGAVHRNVEVYTGFDYFDVGEAHINSLIAGLRIWF